MAHDVFISYSAGDKAVAEEVCATLESRNIRCWIAPRDVLPGTEWAEAIVDAIDESRVFILVLSSVSNSSPQVIREVGRAASKSIPIVPLRIDDVTPSKAMEFFVSSHHFLDAQTPPLEKHLPQLVNTVQQLLTRKGVPQEVIEIAKAKEKREAEIAAKERESREAEERAKWEAEEARRAKEAEKVTAKRSGFWWAGIALLSAGAAWGGMSIAFGPLYNIYTTVEPWYSWFGAMLIVTLPFVISGVCCLRLAIARQFRDEPATGGVPNWWWSLPIVLGFLGGAISWVKQRYVNWRMARNMLTLGILSTFLWAIPFYILVSPVTPPAPPPPATAPPAPAPTPITPPVTPLPGKITLTDAPTILDLSSELPGDFDYETLQHQPGYEYVKLGLDPWSEWYSFVRLSPFQVVRSTMTVLSSEAEISACDELLEDPDRIRSIYVASYQGKRGETSHLVSIEVHPAEIGDVAVLVSEELTQQDYIFQERSLYFRCQNVVVLVSTFYSIEPPPTLELARTIEQRIEDYYE